MVNTSERQQDTDERRIFAQSFGGLNKVANPLNLPYEDSPTLTNCIVDISGNVEKRKGTRMLYNSRETVVTASVIPFSTALNYNFLLMKLDTSLRVFEVFDDVATLVMTKTNVWNTSANERLSVAQTSKPEPRLIMCTGSNKPVQVTFTETQQKKTSTNNVTTFADNRFLNATASNIIVFADRVRIPISSVSYSAGTLTVTSTNSINSGVVVDVVLVTWQWLAEAYTFTGDKLFSTANRFNTTPTDQVVRVPETLTTDILPADTLSSNYRIVASSTSARSTAYTQTDQPQTASQYSYSDGTRYIYSATNFPVKSPYFVVFGALETGGASSTVYFNRRVFLAFNNSKGTLSSNIKVFVDNTQVTQISTAGSTDDVYKNYWLCDKNSNYITSTNITTEQAYYLTFEASRLGLSPTSIVEVMNTEVKHIGSNATSNRFNYDDGSFVPSYGLGDVADYASGFYPRSVSFFQSRLVFCSFPHRALTVLFSNINDSLIAGSYFSSFQIGETSTNETDAFDVVLSSTSDDRVVSVIEWQSSLFVLSRRSVFRLHGGDKPISPESRYISFISNTGVINERCVAQTDFNIVYLSDTGLYDLTPIIENGEYRVRERSLKVRPLFGVTKDIAYENVAWVRYDSEARLVYVGKVVKGDTVTSRDILVYNTLRDSWTEFTTPTGFNVMSATNYVDRLKGNSFLLACTSERNGSSSGNIMLVKLNDSSYVDYRQQATVTGSSVYVPLSPKIRITTNAYQRRYSLSFSETLQYRAFESHPLSDVNDLFVLVGSTVLVSGVDYVKEGNNSIYFIKLPLPNSVVDVYLTDGYSYVSVYYDNVASKAFTINETAMTFNVTPGVKASWGTLYGAVYTTPMFTNQSLQNYKRLKHAYLFFDNYEGLAQYTNADVAVGQDAQQVVDTYKTRINANISVIYNHETTGSTNTDLYGFSDIVWDNDVFDITSPFNQSSRYSLFKETLQGVGYSYQLMVWSFDDASFKLCGYQVSLAQKGKRYTSRL